MKTLAGRVALVTGGAAGVGRGIAAVLAAEEARVAIADIDLAAATTAVAELEAAGSEAIAIETDVADLTSIQPMVDAVCDRWGGVDILAANAGVFPLVEIDDVTDAYLDHIWGINVKGAVHSIRLCLPSMRERGFGRIVLTSSITGPLVGHPGSAVYGASKAALLGLMRSVALEVAGQGITINAVMPGNVRTPGFEAVPEELRRALIAAIPMGRPAEPEEVGWAVRFLASEEAGYITGQTIVLDGGQVLPEA